MNLNSDRICLFGFYAVSVAYIFYIYTLYHSIHRALHARSKKNNSPKVLNEDHKKYHSLKIQPHEKLKKLQISMAKIVSCIPDHSKDKGIQLHFL